ncbi:MAG: hypothetical protein KAI26_02050, partial [Nanoarchaeota archaeon]|nr:hypothetical protein [Nanoarchaeota archaeon]
GRPYDYLNLKVEDPIKIKELFKLVSDNYKDKRFKLFSELYLRSLEGGKIGLDLRFLLLIMALENLYLPGKNQELSFRLSVKVANIISKYGYGKPKENYKIIREIYDVRSSLVHNGKTNKLDNRIFSVLTSIVRISLIIYLRNKNLFSESKPIEEIIFQ